MKKLDKGWISLLLFTMLSIATFVFGLWHNSNKEEIISFGSYDSMYVTCSEDAVSLETSAYMSITNEDSLFYVINETLDYRFIFDLTNKDKKNHPNVGDYEVYIAATDLIAIDYKNKQFLIKNSSGCVFRFYNESDYKRIQRAEL